MLAANREAADFSSKLIEAMAAGLAAIVDYARPIVPLQWGLDIMSIHQL